MNSAFSSSYNNGYYYDSNSYNSWYSDSYDPDKYIKIFGVSASIGTRLKWPDDYFSVSGVISYQRYNLSKWDYFALSTGYSNNFSIGAVL